MRRSLSARGYDCSVTCTRLTETAPAGDGGIVLVQNAWNFIPARELLARIRPYPLMMWPRILARRALSQTNVRTADVVVCMTEYMAQLVSERFPRANIRVAKTVLPMDFISSAADAVEPTVSSNILVPGTVTWYKGSNDAARIARQFIRSDAGSHSTHFAGPSDQSGCSRSVERTLRGTNWRIGAVSRAAMFAAVRDARVVLILSRLESLSFSVAEAACGGAPMIVSDIPVHREVLHVLGATDVVFDDGRASYAEIPPGARVRLSLADAAQQWDKLATALELRKMRDGETPKGRSR